MASLSGLRSNLIALEQGEVISWGDSLIEKKSFLGKVVTLFQGARGSKSREKAIQKTSQLFWRIIIDLDNAKTLFFSHLAREIKGEAFNFKEKKGAEKIILSICQRLKPIIRSLLHGENPPSIEIILSRRGKKSVEKGKESLVPLFATARFCQKLRDFEEITEAEIPFKLLLKLSLDQSLFSKEERLLKKWLESLQKSSVKKIASFNGNVPNGYIQVRFFHRLLNEIVQFFNEEILPGNVVADLGNLEMRLLQLGYKVFELPDYKHMAWRDCLKQGEKIAVGEKSYSLGHLLENFSRDPSLPLVFAIEKDPSLVLVIWPSEVAPYLDDLEERCLHSTIQRAECFSVEKYGRAIVRERLYHSLNTIVWWSIGDSIGQDHDFPLAMPIVELLQGLCALPFTPYPLKPESFAFNKKGEMRATCCLAPFRWDFEAIEQFAYECAKGNPPIFAHLFQASGLKEKEEAKSYQKLVEEAVQGKEKKSVVAPARSSFSPEILEKRHHLYDQIIRVRERMIAEILHRYVVKMDKRFNANVNRGIVEAHSKFCPGSFLIKEFYQKALWQALLILEPPLKGEIYKPIFEKMSQEISKNKEKGEWKERSTYRKEGVFNIPQINEIYRAGQKF